MFSCKRSAVHIILQEYSFCFNWKAKEKHQGDRAPLSKFCSVSHLLSQLVLKETTWSKCNHSTTHHQASISWTHATCLCMNRNERNTIHLSSVKELKKRTLNSKKVLISSQPYLINLIYFMQQGFQYDISNFSVLTANKATSTYGSRARPQYHKWNTVL